MKTETVTLSLLQDLMARTKPYQLRPVESALADEYAEKMKNGVLFPMICVSDVNREKDGPMRFLLDGFTRVTALSRYRKPNEHIEVAVFAHPTLGDFLAEALRLNQHGAQVPHVYRDDRIRALLAAPHHWTQARVAQYYGLTQQSISKIAGGHQKADTAATRGGKGKARAKGKAARIKAIVEGGSEGGPMRLLGWLSSVSSTLDDAAHRTGFIKSLLPRPKDDEKIREAKRAGRELVRTTSMQLLKLAGLIKQGGEPEKQTDKKPAKTNNK